MEDRRTREGMTAQVGVGVSYSPGTGPITHDLPTTDGANCFPRGSTSRVCSQPHPVPVLQKRKLRPEAYDPHPPACLPTFPGGQGAGAQAEKVHWIACPHPVNRAHRGLKDMHVLSKDKLQNRQGIRACSGWEVPRDGR